MNTQQKLILAALIVAVVALAVLMWQGYYTCRPGETGLRIGGVIGNRGC